MKVERPNSPAMDALLGETMQVHDKGFVRLVDYMGNQDSVVQMARTSYGPGTKTKREDRAFVRYLIKNRHTSPLEGCSVKFHIKLPIFAMRQLVRHRTASLNEQSARYSIMEDEFYFPALERIAYQSSTNKQGSAGSVDAATAEKIVSNMQRVAYESYAVYLENVEGHGVARETARESLPVSVYTECYWKIDLHNWLHFLHLRADRAHAQSEIADYADVMLDVLKKWMPNVYEAFMNYRVNAVTFSEGQLKIIRSFINQLGEGTESLESVLFAKKDISLVSNREMNEIKDILLINQQ